ncbi:HNH endonuclease [Rubritalea spongiae]|uniref:HNH endonuclease n=1 Tax=Rubritalea spongiae TaxID=430797 RepID=A0ABW5DZ33_9BACT
MSKHPIFRDYLEKPIPEIFKAAELLSKAVDAHIGGDPRTANNLLKLADYPEIYDWTERLWGKNSFRRHYELDEPLPIIPKEERLKPRMPRAAHKREIIERDGYYCRFCGIPVIPREVCKFLVELYPEAMRWGPANKDRHTALLAMDMVFDHVLPHSRGGSSYPNNMVVACQPCNCGRMENTLEEMGMSDPMTREMKIGSWDGLTRLLKT